MLVVAGQAAVAAEAEVKERVFERHSRSGGGGGGGVLSLIAI